jgi:hypothetical protein
MTPRPSLRSVYRRVERRSCVARQGSRILRPVLLGGWTVEGEYCPSARGQARRHWATLSSLVAGPAPRSSESQVESTPGQRYVGAGEAWPRRSGCTHRALPRRLRAQQAEEGAPYLQEPRPCRAASSKAAAGRAELLPPGGSRTLARDCRPLRLYGGTPRGARGRDVERVAAAHPRAGRPRGRRAGRST